MLNIQSYGSSSEGDSENEEKSTNKAKTEELLHLKPISTEYSVAKSLQVQAAPLVVPVERQLAERAIDPTEKELFYNPR